MTDVIQIQQGSQLDVRVSCNGTCEVKYTVCISRLDGERNVRDDKFRRLAADELPPPPIDSYPEKDSESGSTIRAPDLRAAEAPSNIPSPYFYNDKSTSSWTKPFSSDDDEPPSSSEISLVVVISGILGVSVCALLLSICIGQLLRRSEEKRSKSSKTTHLGIRPFDRVVPVQHESMACAEPIAVPSFPVPRSVPIRREGSGVQRTVQPSANDANPYVTIP